MGRNVATDIHNLAVFSCKNTQSVTNQRTERFGILINKGTYINEL